MSRTCSSRWQRHAAPRAAAAACALVAVVSAGWSLRAAAGAEPAERPWEVAPYRVRVTLAVDAPADPELRNRLGRYLLDRATSALRPLWLLPEIRAGETPAERAACFAGRERPWSELDPDDRAQDKLLWLGVRATPAGYALTCREFDAYLRRWGPVLRREVAQRSSLAEACFRLLTDAFAPLARFESAADGQARLIMKGGALPRPAGPDLFVAPGDVYLPVYRRTGRGGELAEGGVTPLPWTYLVAQQPDKSGWLAEVQSALPRPLAGRFRGNVEQIAISLRSATQPVRVRFFARSNPEQPLAGYEVLRVPPEKASPELLGVTNRDGMFEATLGDAPTATLILRSDGQTLAKLVVARGAAPVLEAPIADDLVRLAAQGEVQAVREELIDVVARRAILMARIRALLKKGELAEARKLMDELNDLPTSSLFGGRINDVANRLPKSQDPRVRQTVEGLFTATRELLNRFLDARAITDLQAQVNEAGR
jgi:hypothetical protein